MEKCGSGPVYASNEDICVQSEFMRPMNIYASNKRVMRPNSNLCVQSKSMRPKAKKKIKNYKINSKKKDFLKFLLQA